MPKDQYESTLHDYSLDFTFESDPAEGHSAGIIPRRVGGHVVCAIALRALRTATVRAEVTLSDVPRVTRPQRC